MYSQNTTTTSEARVGVPVFAREMY